MIERPGLPQQPAVHIDATGRLWLYIPDGDHSAVFDARSGDEIARAGLSSANWAGEFVAHPDAVHVGLSVVQGQDGTNSYWLCLDPTRRTVQTVWSTCSAKAIISSLTSGA